jgi:hypothetical protein
MLVTFILFSLIGKIFRVNLFKLHCIDFIYTYFINKFRYFQIICLRCVLIYEHVDNWNYALNLYYK